MHEQDRQVSSSSVSPSLNLSTVHRFRNVAMIATAATYFLIFIGGVVRVSGSGLGCPDWPTCYGLWIPPTDISQIPAGYDTAGFNALHSWIDYVHRFLGVVVGFLVLITAGLAVKSFSRIPGIVIPSLFALVLVICEGWLGTEVVSSKLEPFVVTVHMVIALVVVSLMIYVTHQAYLFERPETEAAASYPDKAAGWAVLLWAIGIFQIGLGTQVREKLEFINQQFPMLTQEQWIRQIGTVGFIHAFSGAVICAVTWFIGFRILRLSKKSSRLVQQVLNGVMGLSLVEILIGVALVVLGMPDLLQLFHQWISSLYIGLLLILYSSVRLKKSTGVSLI
ncbi:MAG: hypothetical protein HGB19_10545 [Chlorobiales bacterium]|jgi:heme a synthase|nr:hypothetical protein [Chlorobiales bacterium]